MTLKDEINSAEAEVEEQAKSAEAEEKGAVTTEDLKALEEKLLSKMQPEEEVVEEQPSEEFHGFDPDKPMTPREVKKFMDAELGAALNPLVVHPLRDNLISKIEATSEQKQEIKQLADKALQTGFAANMTEAVKIAQRQVVGEVEAKDESTASERIMAQEMRRIGRRGGKELTAEEKLQQAQDLADAEVWAKHGIEE